MSESTTESIRPHEGQVNHELRTAWDFVENTGVSIFLTGKAGTGKTTFLKTLNERLPKRMVVVAPTGVAAINAGGVTIHSFFQLPLAPYIPDSTFKERFDFSAEKRSIIRTMDLLVIDEISMVRSDLLDAIDHVLRRFRNSRLPFGGVQLLMIGDLQQLAPVVTDQEAPLLNRYYETPFFFGSKALQMLNYVTIELKHVYRQSDEHFLLLLNHIREGKATPQDFAELNQRYVPDFRPRPDEGFIRLTTHNAMAQRYNDGELQRLPAHAYIFEAQVEGTFPEFSYPADERLVLKEGAQVMFIKNDPSAEHQFYNGKIGHVVSITKEGITVKCPDDDFTIQVESMEWENTKYVLNEKTKEIESQVQGTFTQYPLRLAWAITIHKSQGLTFERAIIDAASSFASGQLYVALSRCKTLEGLVLASAISERALISDYRIAQYTAWQEQAARQSIAQLPALKEQYFVGLLCELFDFSVLREKEEWLCRTLDEFLYGQYPSLGRSHRAVLQALANDVMGVAAKWHNVIRATPVGQMHAQSFLERVQRSAAYFHTQLTEMLGMLLDDSAVDIDNKMVKKRYDEALADVRMEYLVKTNLMQVFSSQEFDSAAYLRAKNHAILDAIGGSSAKRTRKRKADSVVTPDIKYPDLYRRIFQWRERKALETGSQPANIMQQRAMVNLVNFLPGDLASLVAVPYIGKQSAKRYGEDLLSIVSHYAEKNGLTMLQSRAIKKQTAENKGVPETKQISFNLYKQGRTPEEIAQERGYSVGTIYVHLAYFVKRGDIALSELVSDTQLQTIRRAIGMARGQNSLTAIKSFCTPDIDFGQIRLVLDSMKRES